MHNTFIAVRNYIILHKVLAGIVLVALIAGGYKTYTSLTSTAGETRYITGDATRQTIIASLVGSGQVSTENQIDLKPKASGDIVYLGVTQSGEEVKAGTLIAQIDSTDAQKAVRDAQISLETAQLSLEKLEQPADQLQLTQSANALARTITTKQNAEDNLTKAYDDGFNSISNTFLDLPGAISGLHDILFASNAQLGGTNVNNIDYYANTAGLFDARGTIYGADANNKYQLALAKYNKNFQNFKTLSRTDNTTSIEAVIAETYDTSLAISDAVKSMNNLIQFFEDQMTQHNQKIPTLADTQLATLNGYTGKINSHLTDLLGIANTIKSDTNAIVDAARSIDESTQSLAKLKSGADVLDLRSSQLNVDQRAATLLDAKANLANYYLRAPFDGTIAKLNSKKADSVSPATVVATLITKQKIAQISLNEVDVAKVKLGQKTTLTFDAVSGLSIAGTVSEIDTVGTVSQGVVTYSVKISFDTQDDRVKSGMTVSAAIITDVRQDVLGVPGSAIKTQGENSYVQIFDPPLSGSTGSQGAVSPVAPKQQPVTVGLANDTMTEIISGLKEGDQVVIRTITPTQATAAAAPSLLGGGGRAPGLGGGGRGN